MLMALPNADATFTVTLYLPEDGPESFAAIRDGDDVVALFERHFPDAVELIDDLPRAFVARPTGSLATVRCAPWTAAGRMLLVGDAAHAIVPFFGQGMNCGFEDCTVLDGLLDGPAPRWPDVLDEFDRRRKPDADAIAEMALDNFVEMRDRVGDPAFLLKKAIERRIEREFPGEYRSRYALVVFSRVPYALAREAGRVGSEILDELAANLSDPAQVDLGLAHARIRERLLPLFAAAGVPLDRR
jgi:kynurenine 3-monooxygenase